MKTLLNLQAIKGQSSEDPTSLFAMKLCLMQVCSRPIVDEDEREAIREAQMGNKEHLQDGNKSDLNIVTTPSKTPRG